MDPTWSYGQADIAAAVLANARAAKPDPADEPWYPEPVDDVVEELRAGVSEFWFPDEEPEGIGPREDDR